MAENTETILFNLKIEENRATRKLQEVKEAVNSLDRRTTKYKNTVREQIALETKLTQIRKQRISVNKQSEISLKALNKTQKQAKDATGATTSAALELGRVVSDAPYGIRGMANNLTQLVSQMAFATKAAGGFRLAIKGLWTALMGPLGVVLAITAVISAFDFLYGANKKAENSTNDLTKSIENFADLLRKNANVSIRKYIELMKEKTLIDAQMAKSSEKVHKLEEDIAEAHRVRVIREKRLSKAVHNRDLEQKLLNQAIEREMKLTKELDDVYVNAAKSLNDWREEMRKMSEDDSFENIVQGSVEWYEKTISSFQDTMKKNYDIQTKEGIKAYKEDLKIVKKLQEELDNIIGKKRSGKKDVIKLIDPTEFDAQSKDLMSRVNSVNQQIELALAESEEDKFNIRFRYQQNALQLEKANYIQSINDKYDKELEKYEELVASKKMSEEALALWKENAEANRDKAIDETVSKYDGLFDLFDKLRKARISAMGGADDESKAKELEGLQFYVDAYKEIMGSVSGFLSAESDRELTIEQNKTNALNAELNDRLLNEKLSADQRKSIQNQIWQNDEALRKRQNEIKKRSLTRKKLLT